MNKTQIRKLGRGHPPHGGCGLKSEEYQSEVLKDYVILRMEDDI